MKPYIYIIEQARPRYITNKTLLMRPEGRRKLGIQRKTWLDFMKDNMKEYERG